MAHVKLYHENRFKLLYSIDACPCCGSKSLKLWPALVAPFLARYVLNAPPTRCNLAECGVCSFRFFDSRLTPEEVERLYARYRGAEYFRYRHAAEPWYSRRINNGIGTDPEEIRIRNASLQAFLESHIPFDRVNTVLDYGGDKGQFIPAALGKQKFVFELSDAPPIDGVTRIASESELVGRSFDLTLLLGVLEHCSEPLAILQQLRPLIRTNGHLLIGVPYEWYSLESMGSGNFYKWYLDALFKSGLLLKLVDFYSTIFRVRAARIPPLGILKCHEHLNFFNQKSIAALLQTACLELVSCSITQTCTYPARTFSLNVLAKLQPAR